MSLPVKSLIVYCSPAGSTRHVAGVLEKKLRALGNEVSSLDLGKERHPAAITAPFEDPGCEFCLYIGSPVYGMHAIPPVTDFISNLAGTRKAYAVPFVTWGGSCSGIALYEMGGLLVEKGFTMLGAAKVPAVHSMLWLCDHPLGEGHPDADDDQAAADLVAGVLKKIEERPAEGLPLSRLAYQPEEIHAELINTTYEDAQKKFTRRHVNRDRCTECGICAEECPADAITFSPFPEFGERCFSCFRCLRVCPEQAIEADLSMQEAKVRKRAAQVREPQGPKIFI